VRDDGPELSGDVGRSLLSRRGTVTLRVGMRVLFTTTSGRGHFQPMFPLARALEHAGHEMRWACAANICGELRGKRFDARPAGIYELDPSPLRHPPPEVAALPPAERPDHLFHLNFGPRRAEPMLADLMPIAEEWRPHLLVCEQGELAGPLAAARLAIPSVTHAFGRLLPAVRLQRAAEAMADLWRAHGLEPRPFAGTYDHLYVDIYPPGLQAADTAHVGAVQRIRPAEPIERDAAAEPVVYVTFGTVFNHDLALFATALEATGKLDVRVVVTLGPGHDPDALGAQPSNVTVAEFIPQAELLPACATVISHGGSGTFLAALAAGVPQVLLPQAADQFLNAEAGVRGGLAVAIAPWELSVARLRAAVERVLEKASFRTAAQRAQTEIAAMPAPSTVVEELKQRFAT
jgi:UDP:flavonoid glycosyltransferase YjiC (YdhE family)